MLGPTVDLAELDLVQEPAVLRIFGEPRDCRTSNRQRQYRLHRVKSHLKRTDAPADDDVAVVEDLHAAFARARMLEAREILALELGRHLCEVEAQDHSAGGIGSLLELVGAIREERHELLVRVRRQRVDPDMVLEPKVGPVVTESLSTVIRSCRQKGHVQHRTLRPS